MQVFSEQQRFTRLVNEYQGRFTRFAYSYVQDRGMAEDIVMEAFFYYWERRHELKTDTNVPAYIVTTIKHKCLNYLEHQRVQYQLAENVREIQAWELQTRIFSLQACEPEELFTAEVREIVNKSLTQLPEQTRRIFLMSRYENKSHKEIAGVLGITTKGVEFHISKALKLLREELRDYYPLLIYFFV